MPDRDQQIRQATTPGTGHLDQVEPRELERFAIESDAAQIPRDHGPKPVQVDHLALQPLDPAAGRSEQIRKLPHGQQRVAAQKVEDLLAASLSDGRGTRPGLIASTGG
ncbi:MAG: hypothetical protein JO352_00735 [Chloroflexi bacterium]|nr:hypothetical protein [Chloroflexota bacterium]MBV9597315.1 hypothetical protein [Chloroflexota bacterium]